MGYRWKEDGKRAVSDDVTKLFDRRLRVSTAITEAALRTIG